MNTAKDIKVQNQQDFWSMLYLYLGESLRDVCGRRGTEVIREATRKMGHAYGSEICEEYKKNRIKTNLETLYAKESGCSNDPRVRMNIIEKREEVMRYEVYTCPMADFWLDRDAAWLGTIFCEEWHRGMIASFTDDVAKFYQTKKMITHRTNGCRPDNHCKYTIYYRAAITGEDHRSQSFTGEGEESGIERVVKDDISSQLHKKSVQLLTFLTNEAEAALGNDGLSAIALGLRKLVMPTAQMMRHYAEMTLSPDLQEFLDENISLALGQQMETDWCGYEDGAAKKLFMINFASPLKKELGLTD